MSRTDLNSTDSITDDGNNTNKNSNHSELFSECEENYSNKNSDKNFYSNTKEKNDNDESSSEEMLNLIFLKEFYVLCPECGGNYLFKLHNLNYMNVECQCKYIRYCTFSEFFREIKCKKTKLEDVPFGCNDHKEGGKKKAYIKYCSDCKKDLCKECLEVLAYYNVDGGKIKAHSTHNVIDLLDNSEIIQEVTKLVKNNVELNAYKKHLIINLLNNYNNCVSYYAYKTIKRIKKMLSNEKPEEKLPEVIQYKELKKINSIEKLKENINSPEEIYKIEISEKKENEALEDLDIFKGKNFDELKVLQIGYCKNLKNISALKTCSFPKLEKLIIGWSGLNDECIKVIKKMNLPKIKFISFYKNNINSPEIFGVVKEFITLEKYYIGLNTIDISKLPKDIAEYKFPENLEELGVSNMFTEKTNNFITNHLNLENIKILYVNGNEITSLKQYEKKFKRLEEFWIRGDTEKGCLKSIKEFAYLPNKDNIKKIVAIQNKINDIENFVDIIFSFKNLELLNLKNNGIDEIGIRDVEEKLKEKGFKNLIIKY